MLNTLGLVGIIPVIKVQDAKDAVPLCAALQRGGLPVAEITFRTQAAEEAIHLVRQQLPRVLLGAGTVLTTQQADAAILAGAGFLVSPGFNQQVVRHALDKGIPMLPGCSSASDIEAALSLGLDAVKFFPAEAAGGVRMLKALSGPYSGLRFVPTGGITDKNLQDYLALPQVLACGGSWMVPEDAIAQKDWDRVEHLAREAVAGMLGFELLHVGLNAQNGEDAMEGARLLSHLTGWPIRDLGDMNCFVGQGFEIMKHSGRGRNGHIAIGCHSPKRARWHLEQKGYHFLEDSVVLAPDGQLRLIYLKEEALGFALHLVQK